MLLDARVPRGLGGRWYGVFPALVSDVKDPDGMGRVKVKLPWLSPDDESNWARIASPMAGNDRGLFLLPEVDDEVLVCFEQGDVRVPYILGGLWNGKDAPPETMDGAGNNYLKVLRSRNGVKVTLDAKEIEVKSSANAKVEAGGNMDLKATGQMNVKGATVNLN